MRAGDQGACLALPGDLHRERGMKRLTQDGAELPALADHLTAHGLVLEMLAGPLVGVYDPAGLGRLLFGFFATTAETEREIVREATLEGLDAASRKGKHGGRPPVITDNMLHTVLRRRAMGETVEQTPKPSRPRTRTSPPSTSATAAPNSYSPLHATCR